MDNQYAGMGGSYAVDAGGALKLMERTDAPPDPVRPEPPESAISDRPAPAGFFTPVIPATPADTTTHTE